MTVRKKVLAWAAKLEREAAIEWELARGPGTSKLPAHKRNAHLDNWRACLFAASKFREFAKTIEEA